MIGALLLVACGDPSTIGGPSGKEQAPYTNSSPFVASSVPVGYRLVAAGMGTSAGDWGSDSSGTHEPFTVLSPDGTATSPDVVVVSTTGFEGYQGGLAQASTGYLAAEREDVEVDGRPGIYMPPLTVEGAEQWADLVVDVGGDVAVRVTSRSGTLADLRAIFERVQVPDDRTRAPVVQGAPEGLNVVGSVDVDAVLAMDAAVLEHSDHVPGGPSSHGAGWVRGDDGGATLTVITLPAASVDLAALPASIVFGSQSRTTWETRSVGTRPGFLRERSAETSETWASRSLWTTTAWGDVLVVGATGAELPTVDELVAMAESVRRADATEWESFVVEAHGGPGLHPDAGRIELARGEIDGVAWLLQNGPPGGGALVGSDIDPASTSGVDPCLKLSTRKRACASTGGGSADDWIVFTTLDEGLTFVVVSTTVDAPMVRVTTADDEATVPLVPVPGGRVRGAVVFVDGPGTAVCPRSGTPAPSMATMTVEAVDAAGAVIACLGLGGLPDEAAG